MANPSFTPDPLGDGSGILITWTLTSADPIGGWVAFPEWADRCFTATGTWGGATMAVQGSNDGSNSVPLSNGATGTAATASTDAAIAPFETVRFVRPNLTTPGAGATVTATLFARRATPMRT